MTDPPESSLRMTSQCSCMYSTAGRLARLKPRRHLESGC
jgi:hypothetical protein